MTENNEISNSQNNIKAKNISPVIFNDLILFKEEILKEMKLYQNKINDTVSKNYEDFSKLLDVANNKLYNYETDKALFMKQIEFIEEKNKLLSSVDEKNNELKNQLMVIDLHLKTCQKELDDACFKYDKVIIDNLLIPGFVGKGCKFPYFKEYINDIQGQINIAVSQNQQNANNLTANKQIVEGQIRQLNTKFKKLEYDSKQFTIEKNLLIENKFNQMFESLNNQFSSSTTEYLKTNIELKNKISDIKSLSKSIVEENKKINYKTISEFEKIKKHFKRLKKNIVELSFLLSSGGRGLSGGGKYNKNIANNREQIIQQFNSMIIGLMKDVTKENSLEFNNEINNVLFPKKNVGSLIKKYIEGKIQAEDTKFEEKNKKKYNRLKTISDILNKGPGPKKFNSSPKNKNINLNFNATGNNNKSFSRKLTAEVNNINTNNKHNFGLNNNNESTSKIKNIMSKNISQIHIIKEEKNNLSRSISDSNSISNEITDLNEKSIINSKIYSKNSNEQNNIFNIKTDNSFKNENKKVLFRAATSNYDNKLFNFQNKNIDNMKLLMKVQYNNNKNNFEKTTYFKKESSNSINKSIDKYQNEINLLEKDENYKNEEVKSNSILKKSEKNINEKLRENHSYGKIKENDNKIGNLNNTNEFILEDGNDMKLIESNIKKENKNLIIKNANKTEDNIKIIKLQNEEKKNKINQINNLNNNNSSPIPIKSKNINIKNNFKKNQLIQNNLPIKEKQNDYSTDSNFLKYSKNINSYRNNFQKEALFSFIDNNKSSNINQNNIKNNTLSATNKRRPLSIMNSCQTRPSSKFRIKTNYNIFNDDIFINKNEIKNLNYCKDEKIIDKPLLINQTDFKVDNLKGSLENKLVQLEHFTKRKLDELVKEIKNFIPIHFNAYIKE